tara:strand:+ start:60 stop:311 length:252 start_codon:yes stop_codon:yes gene_type:complete
MKHYRIKEKLEYSEQVTTWLSPGHLWFFNDVSAMIRRNQGDDTCVKTNGAGKIALFRTMGGFSKVEEMVSTGERKPIKKRKLK